MSQPQPTTADLAEALSRLADDFDLLIDGRHWLETIYHLADNRTPGWYEAAVKGAPNAELLEVAAMLRLAAQALR